MKRTENIQRMLSGVARVAAGLMFCLGAAAQDIHFSQFYEAPLWRNPSLAGIYTGDVRVQAVYRDQWNSVTDAYRTGSVNAEFKFPVGRSDDFISTGMQILFDRAGTIGWTTAHVLPAFNYHKSLSAVDNRYLSLGVMGGWVQRRFDPSKMTTNTSYNNGFTGTGENLPSTQFSYIDGSVGLSYNSNLGSDPANNYFLGAAYHHFNRPKGSFYRNADIELMPKWVFSGGLKFGVTDYSYLTIQGDQSFQGEFAETVAGAMYGFKIGEEPDNPRYTIHAGAFLRWNDAIIPALKLDYNPFSVSISYDVNISKLKPSSYGRGGFELSVSYVGFRRAKGEYLLCPRF